HVLALCATSLLSLDIHGQYDLDGVLRNMEQQQRRMLSEQEAMRGRLDSVKLAIIRRDLRAMGLPKVLDGEEVITHPGHLLVYNEKHEQPKWVAHIATPDLITGNLAR